MKHPIPPGSRDILPEEMRELRALQRQLAAVFESFGYGEVATPTIEYDEVLSRVGSTSAPAAHRFFDEAGDLLGMRSDVTVPIARMVANRFADEEEPLRFFYNARAFRAIRPQRGQMREFFQAGVELIGVDAPEGTIEVVEVLTAALEATGLGRAVIGLGDADLYRQLLAEMGVTGAPLDAVLDTLARHDLVGLESELRALGLPGDDLQTLIKLPELRGGAEVLEEAKALGGEAVGRATARLAATYEGLAQRGIASRVQLDLGLLRDLGYYTGAILEVYDPAVGHVLGGGGRYDEMMGRFGRKLPAAGFGLYLERVHIAQAQEEKLSAEAEGGGQ
jgi:ATP phosphoribosyltransferase regulatory subunit